MTVWIVACPVTGALTAHPTRTDATYYALDMNKESRHSYRLWRLDDTELRLEGELYRKFGDAFDPNDCWKKE